jgi:hypothetical protein
MISGSSAKLLVPPSIDLPERLGLGIFRNRTSIFSETFEASRTYKNGNGFGLHVPLYNRVMLMDQHTNMHS